jgi:succinate dehydrogenase / fumarate reductase membrane anchor subunit
MVSYYKRNPVGARYGLADWLLQRLTAVVMAVYTPVIVACVLIYRPTTFAAWQAMFAGQFVRLATILFIAALLYHAWIGVRDIVMDYMKPVAVRLAALTVFGFGLIACFAWAIAILWGR